MATKLFTIKTKSQVTFSYFRWETVIPLDPPEALAQLLKYLSTYFSFWYFTWVFHFGRLFTFPQCVVEEHTHSSFVYFFFYFYVTVVVVVSCRFIHLHSTWELFINCEKQWCFVLIQLTFRHLTRLRTGTSRVYNRYYISFGRGKPWDPPGRVWACGYG